MSEQKAFQSHLVEAYIHDLLAVLELDYTKDLVCNIDEDDVVEFMFKEITEETQKSQPQNFLGLVHIDDELESFYDVACLKEINPPTDLTQLLRWLNYINNQYTSIKFTLLEPEDEESNYALCAVQTITCGPEVSNRTSVLRTLLNLRQQIIDIFGQVS